MSAIRMWILEKLAGKNLSREELMAGIREEGTSLIHEEQLDAELTALLSEQEIATNQGKFHRPEIERKPNKTRNAEAR